MADVPAVDTQDVEDLEDARDKEVEAAEEQILDQPTAARRIAELRGEIATLQQLEALAASGCGDQGRRGSRPFPDSRSARLSPKADSPFQCLHEARTGGIED